jgi:hypothetical protein
MVLAMPHAPGLLSWKTKKSAKGSKWVTLQNSSHPNFLYQFEIACEYTIRNILLEWILWSLKFKYS